MDTDDDTPPVQVFRAPMRSRRPEVEEGAAVERALQSGLCGIDGVLDPAPRDLDEAVARAAEHDERLARRLDRFARAAEGSAVWTRDSDGEHWLGRLGGPWHYDADVLARELGLVHVRPCRWRASPIAAHLVPAAVRAAFARGGLNWQRIRAEGALEESLRLF